MSASRSKACIASGESAARALVFMGILVLMGCFAAGPAQAQQDPANIGPVTKLPLPRFVSLKPSDTPMREGPSKDHRIKWVFKREGLPVEVIGEFGLWRRIRDSESTDGWVYHGRLSNRRTVIVQAPKAGSEQRLVKDESDSSGLVAKLEPGVIANVEHCSASWCKVSVEGYSGFVRKDAVWGVYPDERIK